MSPVRVRPSPYDYLQKNKLLKNLNHNKLEIMDCSICCEKFNKSNRLKVECKGCQEDIFACRTCCQTYILNRSDNPSCMFCKTDWDREFMNENLTQKFVNEELKKHQENIFVEKQISLLPETQKDAIKEKEIRNITKLREDANIELNKLKKMIHDQTELIKSYNLQIFRIKTGHAEKQKEDENFNCKCPATECNGFLNSKYFCEMCDTKFCRHCMEIKEEDHVCNEDVKATIAAIKKQAKPCPGCGEMISKIDGCDQMWCIRCHIQFSWRTGTELKGYNHNPEYFRWMRETGKDIDRNPYENNNQQMVCGVALNHSTINNIISNVFPKNPGTITYVMSMYRFYRHAEDAITLRNQHENNREEQTLKSLRVKYLLKEITKDQWKKQLQQIDKKSKKLNEINNVWGLVNLVLNNYMEQLITLNEAGASVANYTKLIRESINFRDYINNKFLKISNVYKSSTCPGINDRWFEVYNYKQYIKRRNAEIQS